MTTTFTFKADDKLTSQLATMTAAMKKAETQADQMAKALTQAGMAQDQAARIAQEVYAPQVGQAHSQFVNYLRNAGGAAKFTAQDVMQLSFAMDDFMTVAAMSKDPMQGLIMGFRAAGNNVSMILMKFSPLLVMLPSAITLVTTLGASFFKMGKSAEDAGKSAEKSAKQTIDVWNKALDWNASRQNLGLATGLGGPLGDVPGARTKFAAEQRKLRTATDEDAKTVADIQGKLDALKLTSVGAMAPGAAMPFGPIGLGLYMDQVVGTGLTGRFNEAWTKKDRKILEEKLREANEKLMESQQDLQTNEQIVREQEAARMAELTKIEDFEDPRAKRLRIEERLGSGLFSSATEIGTMQDREDLLKKSLQEELAKPVTDEGDKRIAKFRQGLKEIQDEWNAFEERGLKWLIERNDLQKILDEQNAKADELRNRDPAKTAEEESQRQDELLTADTLLSTYNDLRTLKEKIAAVDAEREGLTKDFQEWAKQEGVTIEETVKRRKALDEQLKDIAEDRNRLAERENELIARAENLRDEARDKERAWLDEREDLEDRERAKKEDARKKELEHLDELRKRQLDLAKEKDALLKNDIRQMQALLGGNRPREGGGPAWGGMGGGGPGDIGGFFFDGPAVASRGGGQRQKPGPQFGFGAMLAAMPGIVGLGAVQGRPRVPGAFDWRLPMMGMPFGGNAAGGMMNQRGDVQIRQQIQNLAADGTPMGQMMAKLVGDLGEGMLRKMIVKARREEIFDEAQKKLDVLDPNDKIARGAIEAQRDAELENVPREVGKDWRGGNISRDDLTDVGAELVNEQVKQGVNRGIIDQKQADLIHGLIQGLQDQAANDERMERNLDGLKAMLMAVLGGRRGRAQRGGM